MPIFAAQASENIPRNVKNPPGPLKKGELLKCNFFADWVFIHRAGKTHEVDKNERISLREKPNGIDQ